MTKRHFILLLILVALLTSCRKSVGPTNVRVEDPTRHYLPVLCGTQLKMLWKLYNDGPEPLVIEDIQPACSAITLQTTVAKVIPEGDSIVMVFNFDTQSNLNYAQHSIRIFGNIEPEGEVELNFDVHIVPPSVDQSDYEEKYFHRLNLAGATDAETHTHLYFTDSVSADQILGY